MPDPLVLAADLETELSERKSRFLTRLHRVSSGEEADALSRAARADHTDARHHCTALVLAPRGEAPEWTRSTDDCEPAATARMPMLQPLLHAGLLGTLALVVRQYGGALLRAGGLVLAYPAGAQQAVAAAMLLRRTGRVVAQ